ncbi:hypothetical protein TSAR_008242 [Trichomalopsis sarcophagae]|uniref:phospholipase A1 n=1 Tax=Trichomalopsis sarcophagae TaxID=543379 RepID=A0A232FAV6_9HYME|nr:hypothetical protein TSAR_008242 [Trichomalopsis sarcophagae]
MEKLDSAAAAVHLENARGAQVEHDDCMTDFTKERLRERNAEKDLNGTKALKVKFYAISRNSLKRIIIQLGENFNLIDMNFDMNYAHYSWFFGECGCGDDVNIFIVDWSDGSNTWNYFKAAINARTVLWSACSCLQRIERNRKQQIRTALLHGHSLGSHICGTQEAKEQVACVENHGIRSCSAFKNSDKSLKLDNDNTPFVDVIHTNGRVLWMLGLGLPYPVGHVDFYPNGGKLQPGCFLSKPSISDYLPLPSESIHGRSYLYFTDSITASMRDSCSFWAHKWDMSYKNDSILRSKCHSDKCIEIITGSSTPYCMVNTNDKKEVKKIFDKMRRKLQ